ncbi:MAG: type III pantothenate kinase [Oscillospiraceae bacterium]|nr:type III pantothenate kinase [Oscillospiraceae bacterium]
MFLAFDVGNTNITFGAYRGEELLFTSRIATDTMRMEDQYAVEIKNIYDIRTANPDEKPEGAIVSSVVPQLSQRLCKAVKKALGITPLILGPGVKTGLDIRIDNPAQLGADLVAGAVSAVARYPYPCVVCDLGTATTISIIDKEGHMRGGSIHTGIQTSLNALVDRTSLLPQVSIDAPKSVIGTNTVDSIKSGLIFGTAAMLDGMILRIEKELGSRVNVVATGGLAEEVIKHCSSEVIYDENLVLDGLRIIYCKNR